jgi:hypothetical protein
VEACPSALKNKDGDPSVSTCAKTKICWLSTLSIWLEYRVLKCSTCKLHWVIHAWRLLDRVGFNRAHLCFSLTVWFQRKHFKALLAGAAVLAENAMAGEI